MLVVHYELNRTLRDYKPGESYSYKEPLRTWLSINETLTEFTKLVRPPVPATTVFSPARTHPLSILYVEILQLLILNLTLHGAHFNTIPVSQHLPLRAISIPLVACYFNFSLSILQTMALLAIYITLDCAPKGKKAAIAARIKECLPLSFPPTSYYS